MKLARLAPLLALPGLLLLLGPMLDGPAVLSPAYVTPQATVSAYWLRMVERRHAEALDCFVEHDRREVGNVLALPDLVELRCRDFAVSRRTPGVVDVSYQIEYRIAMGDSLAHFGTADRLSFTSSGWKIVRPLLLASEHP